MAAGGLAAAAGVLLFAWRLPEAQPPTTYVGVKGTPSVQLVVRRAGSTRIWDGRSPVRPGDALGLRVACEGLAHVAVVARGTTWTKLKDASCPTDSAPLPFTLVVDAEPGNERFAVVLSREPLPDEGLVRAASSEARGPDLWAVVFDVAKDTGGTR
jgi:hypothetical protein